MPSNKIVAFVHFVWATWDRTEIITPDIERPLYRYIDKVCRDHKCDVLAVGGMPDHVHLLVTFPGTLTFGDLMRDVKGGSSRFVTEELKHGEWFEWQGSYGAFTVSPAHKNKVMAYIRNQKQHHGDDTVWPEAEVSDTDPRPVSAKADTRRNAP